MQLAPMPKSPTPAKHIDILALVRGWSRWRSGTVQEQSVIGDSHITTVGRCIEDMPSTTCTFCIGRGRVPGWRIGSSLEFVTCPPCAGSGKVDLEHTGEKHTPRCCSRCEGKGEIKGATCFRCRGSGITVDVQMQINPAFISATDAGTDDDFDPRYMVIDREVCRFKHEQPNLYAVVACAYMRGRPPAWLTEYQQQHFLVLAHDEIARAVESAA